MLVSQTTIDAYVSIDPARVLALYRKSGSAELCLSYWSETLTADRLRKILQDARADEARAAPAPAEDPVEEVAEPTKRHHRKLPIEKEQAIVVALKTAECVADVSHEQGVSEQVIYRICRGRGMTWPALTPQRRAERIREAHARARAAREAEAEPEEILPYEPDQLDLLEWFSRQEPLP